MEWYWIVLITYIVMCIITFIIAQVDEECALYWAVGIPFLVIWILLYPVRVWVKWKRNKIYYQKHGISRLQYILGKRVK